MNKEILEDTARELQIIDEKLAAINITIDELVEHGIELSRNRKEIAEALGWNLEKET